MSYVSCNLYPFGAHLLVPIKHLQGSSHTSFLAAATNHPASVVSWLVWSELWRNTIYKVFLCWLLLPLTSSLQSTPKDTLPLHTTWELAVSPLSLRMPRLLTPLARHFQSFLHKALNEWRYLSHMTWNISAMVLSTIWSKNNQQRF